VLRRKRMWWVYGEAKQRKTRKRILSEALRLFNGMATSDHPEAIAGGRRISPRTPIPLLAKKDLILLGPITGNHDFSAAFFPARGEPLGGGGTRGKQFLNGPSGKTRMRRNYCWFAHSSIRPQLHVRSCG